MVTRKRRQPFIAGLLSNERGEFTDNRSARDTESVSASDQRRVLIPDRRKLTHVPQPRATVDLPLRRNAIPADARVARLTRPRLLRLPATARAHRAELDIGRTNPHANPAATKAASHEPNRRKTVDLDTPVHSREYGARPIRAATARNSQTISSSLIRGPRTAAEPGRATSAPTISRSHHPHDPSRIGIDSCPHVSHHAARITGPSTPGAVRGVMRPAIRASTMRSGRCSIRSARRDATRRPGDGSVAAFRTSHGHG